MRIKKLSLNNFKNYDHLSLNFETPINCFIGPNGSGKTNILDSIYFLLLTKSFLNTDTQLIKHEQTHTINTLTIEHIKDYFISSKIEKGRKKQFLLNKEPYQRIHEHIGKFPVVIISPYDTNLIHGGSETRRKFFDGMISQTDADYLDTLLSYNKLIKHRNSILKEHLASGRLDNALLDTLDQQIFPLAERIHDKRMQFFQAFLPIFLTRYREITNDKEPVNITYESQQREEEISQLYTRARDKDLILGRTNRGPHKDDYVFEILSTPLSKFGSQGQQKSFVMALKFTNFEILKTHHGTKPVLLLDDIFDRIDEHRISMFVSMVGNEQFGQIFITDTHLDRIRNLFAEFKDKISIFNIEDGALADGT